jgi:hypothetical protein
LKTGFHEARKEYVSGESHVDWLAVISVTCQGFVGRVTLIFAGGAGLDCA